MWRSVRVIAAMAAIVSASTSLADNGTPNLTALQATEQAKSIQYLYEECTAEGSGRQMFCNGFISATFDSMWLLGGSASTRTLGICVDTPVTYGASVQVFKNWAQKHPEKWSIDRLYGVMWALQEAYPCK
jgi:Rap1a immunity proteins